MRMKFKEKEKEELLLEQIMALQDEIERFTDAYECIHDDALRIMKELSFKGYTVDMLKTFIVDLTVMKDELEEQARKRAAIADVFPDAAQQAPMIFSPSETESD